MIKFDLPTWSSKHAVFNVLNISDGLHTTNQVPGEGSGDSLVRVALGMTLLQAGMAKTLLELLPELSSSEDSNVREVVVHGPNTGMGMSAHQTGPGLCDLIISQLKW